MARIIDFHYSITQCFISGSGAFSMYARLITSGRSRLWEQSDSERDDSIRERAQTAVNKYFQRGIEYIEAPKLISDDPSDAPTVPFSKERCLGDGETLCIPFDQYFKREDRKRQCLSDLARTRLIRWTEHPYHLGASMLRNQVQDALEEESRDIASPIKIELYESLDAAFVCHGCNLRQYFGLDSLLWVDDALFCEAHAPPNEQLSMMQKMLSILREYGGEFAPRSRYVIRGYLVV
ncbi:hypothetical protein LTR62_008690 [Meristemomyces frigidus]|uniref:Uncharacterized protein n=1 Tax=Meristemomyces frigidus TaxID=1508187 RepID=A0AAN7YCL9_9PEZI|nr:hypothetical protein LTR62_008690 [Meristemomyces frigidus]